METRNEIRNYISDDDGSLLFIEIEKSETYDIARSRLNAFLNDNLSAENGVEYDFDDKGNKCVVRFKNSSNPNEVKRAMYDTLKRLADRSEILLLEVMGKTANFDTTLNDWECKFLSYLRMERKRNEDVRRWLEDWRKEPIIPKIRRYFFECLI